MEHAYEMTCALCGDSLLLSFGKNKFGETVDYEALRGLVDTGKA